MSVPAARIDFAYMITHRFLKVPADQLAGNTECEQEKNHAHQLRNFIFVL